MTFGPLALSSNDTRLRKLTANACGVVMCGTWNDCFEVAMNCGVRISKLIVVGRSRSVRVVGVCRDRRSVHAGTRSTHLLRSSAHSRWSSAHLPSCSTPSTLLSDGDEVQRKDDDSLATCDDRFSNSLRQLLVRQPVSERARPLSFPIDSVPVAHVCLSAE